MVALQSSAAMQYAAGAGEAIRARHYSRRTEKTYVAWIRRYILFHGKRHPAEMGAAEVTRFLTSLAVDGNVAASSQNQALSARTPSVTFAARWLVAPTKVC